jgi:hypothetical protein
VDATLTTRVATGTGVCIMRGAIAATQAAPAVTSVTTGEQKVTGDIAPP